MDERYPHALAARLDAGAKVSTVALDASDRAAVETTMAGAEVVVQASLPRFNPNVQAGAKANGTHYVDLASDSSDPYVGGAEWERRNLLALIGMGEDPGLSNLMVRAAADRLESVESIRVRDGDSATSPDFAFLPLFSPETFIDETLHASRIWDGGRYRDVPPFGEGETYEFPEPVGPQRVYSVDHEEVDSMPRFVGKGVQYVDFKLAMDEPTVRTLQLLRDLKLLEPGTAESPGPRRAVLRALPKPADLAGRVEGNAALVVEVVGRADGLHRTETIFTTMSHQTAFQDHGVTATAYLTGTPAAVAVLLLLQGKITARGILPPEALEPGPFFPLLAERGISLTERSTVDRSLAS